MENKLILTEIKQALEKTKGAEFYKCALQLNSASYAKYRGNKPWDENEYNQKILENCRNAEIQVVGLADHGNVQSSESLREYLSEHGIHVFPGFEICSHEKVHMVCLFPEHYTSVDLVKILGNLDDGAVDKVATDPSNKTTIQIAKTIFEKGGVWYAAHLTGDCGLLKLQQDGGGLAHIWKQEKWVLAGQIPGKRNELEHKYLQIIENKNSNYKRDNLVSLINAKDIGNPDDLLHTAAGSLIKMTKPSIEALKQAFLDGESRIRRQDEIPDYHQSQLIALSISGGFLDGLQIHFSENLNTLIGGRGTGKSTIIECIRYALDIEPKSDESYKIHNEIVRSNFSDSRIALQVYSNRLGKRFTVERQSGQPNNIYDEDGNLTQQLIKDIIPGIEILGQNEINDIAKERKRQLELLNRFLPLDISDIGNILKRLKENRKKLVLAIDKKEEAEAEVNQMQRLKEQQSSFRQFGLEQKFGEADIYEKEKSRVISRSQQEKDNIEKALKGLEEAMKVDLHFLSEEATKDLINSDLIGKIRLSFNKYLSATKETFFTLREQFNSFSQQHLENQLAWEQRNRIFEDKLKKLIEKLPDMSGKSGKQVAKEYLQITRKLNAIQQSAISLKQHQNYVDELHKERKSLIAELDNNLHEQFITLQREINKLNKKPLKGRLQIEVNKTANRKELKDFLKRFQGISHGKVDWIDNVDQLTISGLCDAIDKGRDELFERYGSFGIKEGVIKLLTNLGTEDRLKLEEVMFHPEPIIQLNVSHRRDSLAIYRPIEELSTGQKCTAILHMLLLDNPDPLIIDQPEDNLDNAFIADQIVADLRKSKVKRQFIFSTHNANIPVFGDAEWMGVLEADEKNASLNDNNVGSIDSLYLKERVEDILEGGKKAFEIRRLKYGF